MVVEKEIVDLNGKELVLRSATEADAEMLIDYLKTICGETKFLIKEPEEITLTIEREIEIINRNNEAERGAMILGFLDGEYVGNCSLNAYGQSRYRHRASVGIALFQKFNGQGIGTAMMRKLISLAKEIGFEQLELEVVAGNERALHLYQKMGFEVYGTFPNNMKYKDGTYADCYFMMKKL